MEGAVERGADEDVHAGVADDEGLGVAALEMLDARDQDRRVGEQRPPGLEAHLEPAAGARLEQRHQPFAVSLDRRHLAVAVGHRPAAAEIEDADRVAVRFELVDERNATSIAST